MASQSPNVRSEEQTVVESDTARAARFLLENSVEIIFPAMYDRGSRRAILDKELLERKAAGFEQVKNWFPFDNDGLERVGLLAQMFPDVVKKAMLLDLRVVLFGEIGNVPFPKLPDTLVHERKQVTWPKDVLNPLQILNLFDYHAEKSAEIIHAAWHGKIKALHDADPNEPVFLMEDWGLNMVSWKRDRFTLMAEKLDGKHRAKAAEDDGDAAQTLEEALDDDAEGVDDDEAH